MAQALDWAVREGEAAAPLLFLLSTLLCAASLWRAHGSAHNSARDSFSSSSSPARAGLRFRRGLILGLLVANAARFVALLTIALLDMGFRPAALDGWGPARIGWLEELLRTMASALFLTACTIVVLFWARLHTMASISQQPVQDCTFVAFNAAGYVLIAVSAGGTYALQAPGAFRACCLVVVGLWDVTVAIALIFFGNRVAADIKELKQRRSAMALRLAALTAICSLCLLLRGLFLGAWAFTPRPPLAGGAGAEADHFSGADGRSNLSSPRRLLDIVGEWVPTITMLVLQSPTPFLLRRRQLLPSSACGSAAQSAEEVEEDPVRWVEEDRESSLLHNDSLSGGRRSKSRSGCSLHAWKQVYPASA